MEQDQSIPNGSPFDDSKALPIQEENNISGLLLDGIVFIAIVAAAIITAPLSMTVTVGLAAAAFALLMVRIFSDNDSSVTTDLSTWLIMGGAAFVAVGAVVSVPILAWAGLGIGTLGISTAVIGSGFTWVAASAAAAFWLYSREGEDEQQMK